MKQRVCSEPESSPAPQLAGLGVLASLSSCRQEVQELLTVAIKGSENALQDNFIYCFKRNICKDQMSLTSQKQDPDDFSHSILVWKLETSLQMVRGFMKWLYHKKIQKTFPFSRFFLEPCCRRRSYMCSSFRDGNSYLPTRKWRTQERLLGA